MRQATLRIHRTPQASKAAAKDVLARQLSQRLGVRAMESDRASADVVLDVRAGAGAEGFSITPGERPGVLEVTGHDELGLLFGVGKILRGTTVDQAGVHLSTWRGATAPKLPMRAIYFATHFHNWYHAGPVQDVCDYVEDLALWGYNHLFVWFDKHHFKGLDDPAVRGLLDRMRAYTARARSLGMKVGIVVVANEAYAQSPKEWHAAKSWGNFGCELCPSKPEGLRQTMQWFEEQFNAIADIGVDTVCIWPYDQGGCSCPECWPWGSNGFLKLAQPIAQLARRVFANPKIILSTWLFDHYIKKNLNGRTDYVEGDEWRDLIRKFQKPQAWVDEILVDSVVVGGKLLPVDGVTPGQLPIVDFPEVSMIGMFPWGGYGANPLPGLFPKWLDRRCAYHGGMVYSEGCYEDLNKVIHAQAYWDPTRASLETVREYAEFEFGAPPEAAELCTQATNLFEQSHFRSKAVVDGKAKFTIKNPARVAETAALIRQIETLLPPEQRKGWRWRLWALRAVIDEELVHNNGFISATCDEAMQELTRMYHSGDATPFTLQPPTLHAVSEVLRKYGELWPWA